MLQHGQNPRIATG